ncbi:MAG: hypothetical protein HY819_05145 [Acidobacteria bacterium]|nr:hypothetical protein [Acidobacteriota bacterium]
MQPEFNPKSSIDKLVKDFELAILSPETFHHQEHVKVAWWYLQHYSLVESIAKFSQALRNFASSLGKENLYHETITLAYILLINERLYKSGKLLSWEEFADANQDLLDKENNVLNKYYNQSTLESDLAREVFLLPDKPLFQS